VPKYIVTNPRVTINGTNVSTSVAAATLELTATDVDVTNFGSSRLDRSSRWNQVWNCITRLPLRIRSRGNQHNSKPASRYNRYRSNQPERNSSVFN
jgi:hypothetical protein